ncbi:MAG: molybdopterin molybdotransferase MoeA, partial [Solirubrobacterales bacterium]
APAERSLAAGEAFRISTGAMVPAGADAVLPVEDAAEEDGHLLPGRPVAMGENIRRAGEDVEVGQTLIGPGQRIGAAEVAVLAAAGVAQIECAVHPRVAILGSGDELVPPGEPLDPGQIHDSNSYALTAQVREAGAEPAHVAHLPDDAEATREAISAGLSPEPHQTSGLPGRKFDAVRGVDVLLVAGGVSVGRHDHVKAALAELGVQERFWRVAMRPGGPTWFGVLPREGGRPTLLFGLPGNPVSAMVTFHLFARPALLAMQGLDPIPGRVHATLATAYRKKPGKAHYLRCRLELTDAGWRAHLTRESQGSHLLTSMLGADALAVIPAGVEEVSAGDQVEIEPLR